MPRTRISHECAGGEPVRRNSTNCRIYFPNCFVYPVKINPCNDFKTEIIVDTLLDPTCSNLLSACHSAGSLAEDIAPLLAVLVGLCIFIPASVMPANERVARGPYEWLKNILRARMLPAAQKAAGHDDALDALATVAKEELLFLNYLAEERRAEEIAVEFAMRLFSVARRDLIVRHGGMIAEAEDEEDNVREPDDVAHDNNMGLNA